MHHFKSTVEVKPELQSGNAHFGAKFAFLCPAWPWNLMDDLEKHWSTYSIVHKALCSISKPLVYSNWSYSPETLNSGMNWRFFVPRDLENLWMTLKTNRPPLVYYVKFVYHFKSIREVKPESQSGNAQFGSKLAIFVPRDLENWRMTMKNNRAHLLCCFKLCASFYVHWRIQTGVTDQKMPNLGQNRKKIAVWPWNLTNDL